MGGWTTRYSSSMPLLGRSPPAEPVRSISPALYKPTGASNVVDASPTLSVALPCSPSPHLVSGVHIGGNLRQHRSAGDVPQQACCIALQRTGCEALSCDGRAATTLPLRSAAHATSLMLHKLLPCQPPSTNTRQLGSEQRSTRPHNNMQQQAAHHTPPTQYTPCRSSCGSAAAARLR